MSQNAVQQDFKIKVDGEEQLDKYNKLLNDNKKATDNVKKSTDSASKSQKNASKQVGGLSDKYKKLASVVKGGAVIGVLTMATKKLVSALIESTKYTNKQIEADTRLTTISRTVTGATDEQIRSMMSLADEMQRVTTVGDEVTQMGMSQLQSFGFNQEATEKLTESMLDLAVATYGTDVNSDQLIQTANMLGKAYTGLPGMLSRAGVLLTDQQKQMIKTGDEAERLGTLVKVIEQNYGGMAKAMAQTPDGKIKQLQNRFNDIKETIGADVLPYLGGFSEMITDIVDSFSDSDEIDNFSDSVKIVANTVLTAGLVVGKGLNDIFSMFNTFIDDSVYVAFSGLQKIGEFVSTQAESWHTVLDFAGVEVGWIDDLAKSSREFENLMAGSAEASNQRTQESVLAWEKRDKAIRGTIASLGEYGRTSVKINDVTAGGNVGAGASGTSSGDGVSDPTGGVASGIMSLHEVFQSANDKILSSQEVANAEIESLWVKSQEQYESIQQEKKDKDEARRREEIEATIAHAELLTSIAQPLTSGIGSLWDGISTARMKQLDVETKAEIDAVKATTKNKKQQAKEIAKIEKESEKERKKIAMAQWVSSIAQATANTFLAGTRVMAEQAGGMISKGVAFATITGLGLGAVGSIIASKPRFYYGSKDSTGAYTEIGGNSAGDAIGANVRSGELIVQAGRDANIAKQALNGGGVGGSQSIQIGSPQVVIQGNADSSTVDQLNEFTRNFGQMVVDVIQNNDNTNLFNQSLAGGF